MSQTQVSLINDRADDFMSSSIVRLTYGIIIIACIILITIYTAMIAFNRKTEGYKSYTSGASLRHVSGFAQPAQGVEGFTPQQEIQYQLKQ